MSGSLQSASRTMKNWPGKVDPAKASERKVNCQVSLAMIRCSTMLVRSNRKPLEHGRSSAIGLPRFSSRLKFRYGLFIDNSSNMCAQRDVPSGMCAKLLAWTCRSVGDFLILSGSRR